MKKRLYLCFAIATVFVALASTSCNKSNSKEATEATCAEIEGGQVSAYDYLIQHAPFTPSLPYSTMDGEIPEKNYVVIYFDRQDKASLKIVGNHTAYDVNLREQILQMVKTLYQEYSNRSVNISDNDIQNYITYGFVGSPLQKLGMEAESNISGIPYTETIGDSELTELQLWIKAIRTVISSTDIPGIDSEDYYADLEQFHLNMRRSHGIIIVADGNMNFNRIVRLFDNLADIGCYRLSIATNEMYLFPHPLGTENDYDLTDNPGLTLYIAANSKWDLNIVEDCDYTGYYEYYSSASLDAPTDRSIAMAPASSYKSIANDGGYDEEELLEEEIEPEICEEVLYEEILSTEPVFGGQIPESRAIEIEIGGDFPSNDWGNVKNLWSGESSGRIPLIKSYESNNNVLKSLTDYNREVISEINSLIQKLGRNEITQNEFEDLKKEVIRQADIEGHSPIVIIRPASDATLSTVMAAISVTNARNIQRYYVVPQSSVKITPTY